MENDELKDILLERDDEAKGLKLKKLLMFIAALVILFLIIVVAMKLVNSGDSTQAQNEADSRLVLPPVPVEQPVDTQAPLANTNTDNKKSDTQLFEQVPIVPENKQQDEFEDMIKKLKDKENNKAVSKTEEPKETANSTEKPVEAPVKKTEVKAETPAKKAEKIAAPEKKTEVKPAKTETKVEKKAEKKSEAKEKVEKKTESAKAESIAKGSYVQVFATSKFNPNAEYMKKIAAKGYNYKTIKVGELTKILVGPFDEKALQKAVNEIRKDVNKDAFIFRAK
ncbi:SPOR domain-containing protein [Campylobacter sp.]|uniref:SPOR domain-containing protein n=1 Tax=Campylobacter sp. TaxID=205 RepID=UPI003FA140E6